MQRNTNHVFLFRLLWSCGLLATASSTPRKKPYNILFLMCDSMDGRVLDPTSAVSKYLEMPYMWNLASQGFNFVNTYANSPQCAPSRTSMFTGRYNHQFKGWSNEKPILATPGSGLETGKWELDPNCIEAYDEALCQMWAKEQNVTATFLDTLKEGGVDVAMYGKVDVGGNLIYRPDQQSHYPSHAGFHIRALDTIGRAADIRKATKDRPDATTNEVTRKIRPHDWNMISRCMDWLENNSKADRSGPWVLYCSLEIPHPPYECSNDTQLGVAENIPLPDWFLSPGEYPESAMHPYDSYMSYSKEMMDEQGKFSRNLLEKNMRCWFAMCNQTDSMLGLVWSKAEETGNLDNTLVVFLSDHGEMHMEHRQHFKNSFYEGSSRVPLLIAGPGSKPGMGSRKAFETQGTIIKDITSLLDIYPTLVDATGASFPDFLEGESLMPYVAGTGRRAKDYAVSMYMSNMANTPAFMVRRGPWKYIAFGTYGPAWYKDYHPQLFNVAEDPKELSDVVGKNGDVAKELDALLRSVVDIDLVDRQVKMEERMLYDRIYKNKLSEKQLREEWGKAYKNFDDADYKRVQIWYNSVESAPQPEDIATSPAAKHDVTIVV